MQIKAPTGAYQLPAAGTYLATLESYEDLGLQPNPFGKDRQKVKLVFDLGSGVKQFAWLSPSLHPSAKFYGVATALLGTNPPEVLELDDLVGLECEVDLEHYTANDGKRRAKISDFRMPRQRNTAKRNPKVVSRSTVETNMHGVEVSDEDVPF